MIKINKDLNNIPASLLSIKTQEKREAVILAGKYDKVYDDYYKKDDVKDLLYKIYNNKCAYCEWRLQQLDVEHYRPKSFYYWLAFSWDNLLMACSICNKAKSSNFSISGNKCTNPPSLKIPLEENRKFFNNLSFDMDAQERPLIINPEVEDPEGHIYFLKTGEIGSYEQRYVHTIDICQLNRPILVDERRRLLNDLKEKIIHDYVRSKSTEKQRNALNKHIEPFMSEAKNESNPFLGFRKYARKHLLREVIKEIKNI